MFKYDPERQLVEVKDRDSKAIVDLKRVVETNATQATPQGIMATVQN